MHRKTNLLYHSHFIPLVRLDNVSQLQETML